MEVTVSINALRLLQTQLKLMRKGRKLYQMPTSLFQLQLMRFALIIDLYILVMCTINCVSVKLNLRAIALTYMISTYPLFEAPKCFHYCLVLFFIGVFVYAQKKQCMNVCMYVQEECLMFHKFHHLSYCCVVLLH